MFVGKLALGQVQLAAAWVERMKIVCQIVLQDLWTQHYLLQIDLPN
jgi:hypothetical protein